MASQHGSAAGTRARLLFWLDVALLAAVVTLETPRGTGLPAHEWLGVILVPAIAVHLLVNWRWIGGTLRRIFAPGSWRGRVNLLLNSSLFVFMIFALFSGLMISEVVLPLAGFQPSTLIAWRKVHSLFSSLSVVIVGFHIALNWDWIAGVIHRRLLAAPSATNGLGEPQGQEAVLDSDPSWVKALDLQDLRSVGFRLVALATTAVAVSAMCLALVTSETGSDRTSTPRLAPRSQQTPMATAVAGRLSKKRIWNSPDLASLPRQLSAMLLMLAILSLVGKYVLRLRL